MTDLAELEARLRRLEDVEAIKRLKHRYFRSLDTQQWDDVLECFSDDAAVDYGPNIRLEGKEALTKHLRERLRMEGSAGVHQGHNPEIDVTDEKTARGTWELYVHSIWKQMNRSLQLAGFYYDDYVKVGGQWRIEKSRMVQVFRDISPLDG